MPTLKFHELRHTFASLMVSYGIPMFELSRLMGHGSIAVTDGCLCPHVQEGLLRATASDSRGLAHEWRSVRRPEAHTCVLGKGLRQQTLCSEATEGHQ